MPKLKIQGVIEGQTYWWRGDSWVHNSADADILLPHEVERRLRIININNRFLDPEDRVEAKAMETD
jgi:hypothetical protein